MHGICTFSILPLRAAPSHKSEMVSQLLFGETYDVLEEPDNDWLRVVTSFDRYEAWLTRQHHTPLSLDEYLSLQDTFPICSLPDCAQLGDAAGEHLFKIMAGSSLPHFESHYCRIGDKKYTYRGGICQNDKHSKQQLIVNYAQRYLYAPYMWGGRSSFGVDCSGLSQMAYKMSGLALPRDAYQQAAEGTRVESLSEAQAGDLAFFKSVNRQDTHVTHVGILLSPQKIIHAAAMVDIDKIDDTGIINSHTGKYSHHLLGIKRYVCVADFHGSDNADS